MSQLPLQAADTRLLEWLGGFGTACLAVSKGPAATALGWPAALSEATDREGQRRRYCRPSRA